MFFRACIKNLMYFSRFIVLNVFEGRNKNNFSVYIHITNKFLANCDLLKSKFNIYIFTDRQLTTLPYMEEKYIC